MDGKVAIIQQGSNDSPAWLVLDTVTDNFLEEDMSFLGGVDDGLSYVELDKAIQKYNIIKNDGRMVKLPYTLPENMQPLTIEYDEIRPGERPNVYAGCHVTAGF